MLPHRRRHRNQPHPRHKHVDMIDLRRFVELLVKHYPSMTEEGRAMLPLAPIYYLVHSDN